MRVFIIEDDVTLRTLLDGLLKDEGYETICADTEQKAENALKEHGSSIALALIDMGLPSKAVDLGDEETGLRLIQLMTKRYPFIIKVVFTGKGDLDNAAKCMEAGAFSYCPKGGSPEKMLDKIRKAEARYLRDQALLHTVGSLKNDVNAIHKRLANIMGVLERVSDELGDAPGDESVHAIDGDSTHGI